MQGGAAMGRAPEAGNDHVEPRYSLEHLGGRCVVQMQKIFDRQVWKGL